MRTMAAIRLTTESAKKAVLAVSYRGQGAGAYRRRGSWTAYVMNVNGGITYFDGATESQAWKSAYRAVVAAVADSIVSVVSM